MPSSHLQAFIDEFSGEEPVTVDPGQVLAMLHQLPDPRARRGVRHRFAHLLVIMLCSVLAGSKTLVEMAEWATDTARQQLEPWGIGTPHATTLARIFQRQDADRLDELASLWAQADIAPIAIAVDGKEVRGAKNGGQPRVHLLSGIDQDSGAVLAQVSVSHKTNEITCFSTLMDRIENLSGVVVTADALHTQVCHANYLNERGAYFILTVKGNQPTHLAKLEAIPWKRVPVRDKTTGTANGREIIRIVKCATLAEGIGFPHAVQAVQITRKSRTVGTKKWFIETVHAVTSIPTHKGTPAQIGAWVRGHWSIENGLHWRRDVTWNEDKSQVRTGHAPRVMATLRNIAITILKQLGHNNVAKATRKIRNYPEQALELIGFNAP
ncbi:ISAs1 family transposase [Glutamicibacter ardleyensis]|uniref:ISAs1 family transposase n=1 Tax=Glutamicibacter ardleyensis TaxID=225894 RepID=UPI003FD08EDA